MAIIVIPKQTRSFKTCQNLFSINNSFGRWIRDLRVEDVVGGWPSGSGVGASDGDANTHHGNLIKHDKNGRPGRPNQPLETWLFAMFDEN
ncbi:unnamed protein product [Lupinus luteus]|uniref:glucan endo-1,3-beta-D-glucosidase n=1 Tax=Lupinus luteus TaxID=3873 RepID=A0AAV1YBZ6_LUPLU